ncbi:amidohydrolase family protein [Bradyrhizobium sp. NP1]|uniref:amidohydrolase family protein n=1 Tax=Bradyrhizobium sp. NP1 TaxID=3049772 RepID=UPI0025A66B5A|nr:amidohydrolase family protein [Bradyrhizobium sp. NP1]WJR78810.1 amidohydrolase family protein [Bradyrhizobium sp. NP1]
MTTSGDFILRNAVLAGRGGHTFDIAIRDGRIAEIAATIESAARAEDLGGSLVLPGFVDSHIHLDKSCILDRCRISQGTLQEAISQVAAAKRDFTEEDVYARAARTLEKAILQGTTAMRTHVEVDARIGLTSFNAIRKLKADYAWAIDLELCVFPQEGLINDPGTEEMLAAACEQGADLIGGCPYADSDRAGHIDRIFKLARRFDLDIDFHLDFDLDPSWTDMAEVCRQADAHRYGGRVAIGHVTKLSAMPPAEFEAWGKRLAAAGVAVTVLPSTDLFLTGRDHDHNVPRGVTHAHKLSAHGVTCSLATNNVLNPFTPFGDCSLIRIANLYANVAQLGDAPSLCSCLDMVTSGPAKLMNVAHYGLDVGNPADLVVIDCREAASAVAEIVAPMSAYKRGRLSFTRARPTLNRPGLGARPPLLRST